MLYVFVGHGLNRIVGISKLLIVDVLLQFWDVNGRQFFVSKQLMLMLVMMMFDDLTAIVCRGPSMGPRSSTAFQGRRGNTRETRDSRTKPTGVTCK